MGLLGAGLPALLAACGDNDNPTLTGGASGSPTAGASPQGGTALVKDVLDFSLDPQGWAGAFGYVTFRMHRGVVDGNDVWFIRTDASDRDYAVEHGLVSVPKLATLAGGDLVTAAYQFEDDPGAPMILSSQPGRDDYTPACELRRVRWLAAAKPIDSAAAVEAAAKAGELEIIRTGVVLNAPFVSWHGGGLPVDAERRDYLGPGQLLEAPDASAKTVTFKLHECFPNARYIVTDVELAPMAEGMNVAHAPRLAGTSEAGANGRVNVLMGGLEGPGPMGAQPSVFDSQAGDPVWSPLWDHWTYAWNDGASARLLPTEADVHAARDAGELKEFAGTPETGGKTFVVNCPVPVLAANSYTG